MTAPRDGDWAQMSEKDFRAMVRSFLRRYYPEATTSEPGAAGLAIPLC